MDLQGHRAFNNPKAMLSSLLNKREKLQDELRSVEKQNCNCGLLLIEFLYMNSRRVTYRKRSLFGNALKGFDGFLSSLKNTAKFQKYRSVKFKQKIRQ
ncbi:hypothetical protein Pfo_016171 [Paulownia fortunei]|nr:hypothetical protein Pfo_016171 [Paulownia fortunei]